MDLHSKKIILGSGSPRRRELLSSMNVEFTVDTGNSFEESFDPSTPHEKVPVLMSEGKSLGFHRPLGEDEILITSDTMVLCMAIPPILPFSASRIPARKRCVCSGSSPAASMRWSLL